MTRQYILSQVGNFQEIQVKKGASEIQDFFDNLDKISASLARTYKYDKKDTEQIASYVISSNPRIIELSFLSTKGKELIKVDTRGVVDKEDLSYEIFSMPFTTAVSGKPSVSKVYYLDGMGPHINLFSPIVDLDNKVVGVIKMQINLNQLREELADVKFGGGYIYVIDKEGSLIAHPSREFVLSRPNLYSRNVISSSLKGEPSKLYSGRYTNERGVDTISKSIKIPDHGWVVVFEQPSKEVFSFLVIMRNLFIATLAGSLVFLLLISFFLSENLTRPIRRLQENVQQFEVGGKRVDFVIKSGDEIESLSHSFTILIDRLVSRERLLRRQSVRLKNANMGLKELDHFKDEFIAIASHELKTPLAVMKTNIWMLAYLSKGFNKKQKKYVKDIEYGVKRMSRVVSNLLDISRIEQNRFILSIEKHNLTSIIDSVVTDLKKLAEKKGLKMIFEKPNKNIIVCTDKDRIVEVLTNYISNSIKYTEKGGIKVALEKVGGNVRVNVADTGPGIAPKDKRKIFTRFGRAGEGLRRSAVGASTGLGLYISKRIIEEMGGKVGFNSKSKVGSVFWFEIPIKTKCVGSTSAKGKVSKDQQVSPGLKKDIKNR